MKDSFQTNNSIGASKLMEGSLTQSNMPILSLEIQTRGLKVMEMLLTRDPMADHVSRKPGTLYSKVKNDGYYNSERTGEFVFNSGIQDSPILYERISRSKFTEFDEKDTDELLKAYEVKKPKLPDEGEAKTYKAGGSQWKYKIYVVCQEGEYLVYIKDTTSNE